MADSAEVLAFFKVLAWPFVVLVAILVFRRALRRLIEGIEEVEGFGVKARIRREVGEAADSANQALDRSRVERGIRPAGAIVLVAVNMQRALRASHQLTPPEPAGDGRTRWVRQMRSRVAQLDTALVAVIVAAGMDPERVGQLTVSGSDLTVSGSDADALDRYMVTVTGVTGWKGVVEARNVLHVAVAGICAGSAPAVTSAYAAEFIGAGERAFGRLGRLVDEVMGWRDDA